MDTFRKPTMADIKIGTYYIIRFSGHSDQESVNSSIKDYVNKVHKLNKIEYIKDGRIVYGPSGSTDSYCGIGEENPTKPEQLGILIPTCKKVIADYESYQEIWDNEVIKNPFQGRTADDECDWDSDIRELVSNRFTKEKLYKVRIKKLGRILN